MHDDDGGGRAAAGCDRTGPQNHEQGLGQASIPLNADAADPFDLNRFVEAQRSNYAEAIAELRAGKKRSHWSWYVLPQIAGLGHSAMSRRYAISGLAEAAAYLAHPVLGARLRESVAALNRHAGFSADDILGSIDAQKFRSCVTLFGRVEGAGFEFGDALRNYFAGREDPATVSALTRTRERL